MFLLQVAYHLHIESLALCHSARFYHRQTWAEIFFPDSMIDSLRISQPIYPLHDSRRNTVILINQSLTISFSHQPPIAESTEHRQLIAVIIPAKRKTRRRRNEAGRFFLRLLFYLFTLFKKIF